MHRLLPLLLICALPLAGRAQITAVGLTAGVNIGNSTEYMFETDLYYVKLEDVGSGGSFSPGTNVYLNFGLLLEHYLQRKFYFSHNVILHQYYPGYAITDKTYGSLYNITSGVFAVTYTGMVRVFNKGGGRLLVGPGIDINSISASTPTFNDNNLNELASQLHQTYNPIVFYAGAELGYRAGRVDISLKYNHSLNSLTGALDYQGQNYVIPSRQAFIFFNVGFLIYDRELSKTKTISP